MHVMFVTNQSQIVDKPIFVLTLNLFLKGPVCEFYNYILREREHSSTYLCLLWCMITFT